MSGNIAEGAGRRTPADKAHFFTIARGSATESAAVLELLAARGFLSSPAYRHGRGLLVRVVQMLTRLIAPPFMNELRLASGRPRLLRGPIL